MFIEMVKPVPRPISALQQQPKIRRGKTPPFLDRVHFGSRPNQLSPFVGMKSGGTRSQWHSQHCSKNTETTIFVQKRRI